MTRFQFVIFLIVASMSTSIQIPTLAIASTSHLTVVIQIDQVGGFVGPNFKSARLPIAIAYSDGRVMAPRSTPTSVKEMYMGTLTPAVLKSQISIFAKAIRTPSGGWGMPGVADVPSTVVSVSVSGAKHSTNVYALGFSSKPMSANSLSARTRLAEAIAALIKLAGTGNVYLPSKFEAWPLWLGTKTTGLGMANPAAVFCISQNGTLVPVSQIPTPPTPLPDSSVNYCRRSDGTYVEEWTYFRQASKVGIVWPANVPSLTSTCTVIAAKPFLSLLRNVGSRQWLFPSGGMTAITWRPILPLEIGCRR